MRIIILDRVRFFTARVIILTLAAFLFMHTASAQQSYFDSLLNATLVEDSLFLDELLSNDSQTILDLLDSMINIGEPASSISARLGYSSNIAYAGRNFGIQQYGFSAGLSYYHKSGLFADAMGFWNSEVSPSYNPTITSLGYIGTIGKKMSFIFNYDHYFYQQDQEDDVISTYPLTNAISASTYYDFKHLSLGTDYSFMFGDETAHRIRLNLIKRIKWYNKGIFDRISISPGASMLAGNQNIYTISQSYQTVEEDLWKAISQKYNVNFSDLRRLKNNRPILFKAMVASVIKNNVTLVTQETTDNIFGIMNYSISIPAYFTINKFTVGLGYSLNIPVALPGENVEYEPNSYFNVSLIYTFFFK